MTLIYIVVEADGRVNKTPRPAISLSDDELADRKLQKLKKAGVRGAFWTDGRTLHSYGKVAWVPNLMRRLEEFA